MRVRELGVRVRVRVRARATAWPHDGTRRPHLHALALGWEPYIHAYIHAYRHTCMHNTYITSMHWPSGGSQRGRAAHRRGDAQEAHGRERPLLAVEADLHGHVKEASSSQRRGRHRRAQARGIRERRTTDRVPAAVLMTDSHSSIWRAVCPPRLDAQRGDRAPTCNGCDGCNAWTSGWCNGCNGCNCVQCVQCVQCAQCVQCVQCTACTRICSAYAGLCPRLDARKGGRAGSPHVRSGEPQSGDVSSGNTCAEC